MVHINIRARHAFLFVVVLLVGFAIAYGGNQPTVMGHSSGEINVTVPGGGSKSLQQAINDGDFAPPSPVRVMSGTKNFVPSSSWQTLLSASDFNLAGKKSGAFLVRVGPIDAFNQVGGQGTYDMSASFMVTIPETTNELSIVRSIPASVSAHSFGTGNMEFRFVTRQGQVPGVIEARITTFNNNPVDIPYSIVEITGFSY